MDVLLQRVGRLHRHRRNRDHLPGFDKPRVVVLVPDEDLGQRLRPDGEVRGGHGYGRVYPDLRVLELTWQTLSKHPILHIPKDNRFLVEATLHPEAFDALLKSRSDGVRWKKHGEVLGAQIIGDRSLAAKNTINRTKDIQACNFPDKEFNDAVRTRLGLDDREVLFAESPIGPFGNKIRQLNIPGWMLSGQAAADDESALVKKTSPTQIEFSFAEQDFVYDALGLRPWEAA
jgi:CRISPR-associated endonuclease/helicase Cas3